MKRFLFTVAILILISAFVFEPLLEHITGVQEELFNLIWWIDLCMMIAATFPIHFVYDKYIGK
jgi:hypothetical protein